MVSHFFTQLREVRTEMKIVGKRALTVVGVATLTAWLAVSVTAAVQTVNAPANAAAAAQVSPGCAPAPKSTTRKIAIVGDSITTQYGASTPAKSWPERLKAQGATHSWQVSLHGQGGSMAAMYLPGGPYHWVTQQVRSAKPDVVTLDFRANEHLGQPGWPARTPSQLKSDMLALVAQIREVSPSTQFLVINPHVLWYHGFYTTPYTQDDYAGKAWEVARDVQGCWLDMRPFFSQTGRDPDVPDDIHVNDNGHGKYYAAVYATLLQHCGVGM